MASTLTVEEKKKERKREAQRITTGTGECVPGVSLSLEMAGIEVLAAESRQGLSTNQPVGCERGKKKKKKKKKKKGFVRHLQWIWVWKSLKETRAFTIIDPESS